MGGGTWAYAFGSVRMMRKMVFPLLLLLGACDSNADVDAFVDDAGAPPSGYTQTNAFGVLGSEDADDWRTSPAFLGKVRVDPAYPNPTDGRLVTIQVSVLEFNAVRGGIVLRALNNAGRLVILDELLEASSPGGYSLQFTPALLARTGLVRLFVLDRFGELISYGDLLIE